MKKQLSFFFLLASIFITTIYFTSCENFLQGSILKGEIESAIEYSNAPEYSVSVVSTNTGWGTITAGGGDHKKKISDSIILNFSLNDGYKFLKWKAVDKIDNSVSLADYVDFTNQTEPSASVTLIKGSDNILITPVCAQLFAVSGNFTDDGKASYNRDSTIIITFNQKLAESTELINNIDNIIIAVSGITDADEYFDKPVISENKIIISCKTENLIPVAENTTRVVTVTIPSDFCYYEENVKMELGQKYVLSYTIDSSTSEKTSIKFSNKDSGDDNAVFTVDGVTATGAAADYSIGQTINLTYKGTDDYVFNGFTASEEDVVLISEPEYNENKNLYTATATVLTGGAEITITPTVTIREKITLKFAKEDSGDANAVFTVEGATATGASTKYYIDTKINISYKGTADYIFKGFSASVEEAVSISEPEYDENKKTYNATVTVLSGSVEVTITPVTILRDKLTLKFAKDISDDAKAVFTVDGVTATGSTTKYDIGDEISLSYKKTDDYLFTGFTASIDGKITITEPEYDEGKKTYTATVKVVEGGDFVTVTPSISLRDKLTLKFAAENGTVTPNAETSYYKDESFDLKFTALTGYALYEWQLLNKDQSNTLTLDDYFDDFDAKAEEQKVIVKNAGNDLTLKAIGEERPKVSLTLPANGKDNVVRNTVIKIMFSKPMDDSKFTSEYIEVKQGVMRDTGDAIILESEPVENLTYIKNSDNTMLTVQLPEGKYYITNSYINVKISKDLCTQDKKIEMSDDYEFQFQVGTETDGLAPVIDTITVTSGNAPNKKTYEIIDFGTNGNYDRDKVDSVAKINAAYKINDTDAVQSSENVLKNIVSGATFNIHVKASDLDGAGSSVSSTRKEANVSKIGYRVTNVISMTNGNYSFNNNDPFIYENTLPYSSTDGSGENFLINLSDLDGHNLKAPEGILRVDVYAIDKKENSGYWETMWYKYQNGYRTFFVINDTTAPVISEPVWQKTFTKFDFTAPGGSEPDYKADPQYISNKTYLKFKLDETTCGVTDMDIELKSAAGTVSLKDKVQIRYASTDSFANSVPLNINSQESTATKMVFNPAVEDKLPAYHSGWYYITNIVDSSLTDDYTLTVKLTDAAGFVTKQLISTVKSDCSIPQWDSTEGPKVIQYTYGTGNNANNVFPRVDNRGITSKSFRGKPEIKNTSGNYVRWFYTNASSSGNFGVALKQELTKETNDKIKYLYSANTLSDSDISNISLENIHKNGTEFNGNLSNYFYKTGTYSFAVFDEAENCTDIQTFVIVRDNVRPTRVTSAKYISSDELLNYPNSYGANSIVAGNNRDIKFLFSLSTDCEVSVNNSPQYAYSHYATNNADWRLWCSSKNNTTGHFSRYSTFTGSAQAIKNSKWIMRVTGSDTSNQVFIATTISTSNGNKVYTKVDSNLRSVSGEYWEDAYPSRTGSGITNYYIARTYNKWRGSSGSTTVWEPNFPEGTDLSGLTLTDVKAQTYLKEANSEGPVCCSAEIAQAYGLTYDQYYHGGWVDYDVNIDGDIEIPIYSGPTPEDYNYKYGAPIAVCFKDGCGNLNFVNITRPGWNEYAHYAYDFNFTN